jgi:predicted nucleic acid-binding protein
LVKVLFDTNVVICAVLASHPMYPRCLPWLRRVQTGEIEGVLSLHSLAEIYSVLTKLPLPQRVTAMAAQQIISRNLSMFVMVGLAFEDYQAAIDRAVQARVISGGVFDALIAQTALKAEVDVLITLNAKDFMRLGEAIDRLVQVPT